MPGVELPVPAARGSLRLLRRLSNTLVDLVYVITAYVTVIAPLLAALDVVSLGWVTIVLVVLLIVAALRKAGVEVARIKG